MRDNRPPKAERILKQGHVRSDGMIFWQYMPRSLNGERWLTPDKYEHYKSKATEVSNARSKESNSISHRKYYVKNSEYLKLYQTEYRSNNKAIISKCRRNRIASDPSFKLAANMRTRMCRAVTGQFAMKAGPTFELTGCDASELKLHLESKFTEGMSWGNYGLHGWHIDHIKPCASFDLLLDSEQRKCFHYSNLQPLWAEDNWKKGDNWNG